MNKIAVCFTHNGEKVIERLNEESLKKGITPVKAYVLRDCDKAPEDFIKVTSSIGEWTGDMFMPGNALIFVGAAGIAVRALSGLARDKLSDCPVIVIDDEGTFVIPILSGHAGGANKLAVTISELLGAVPVITTSTDVNAAFSVDSFAAERGLCIVNREGIKKVSAKAIEGKNITLSIKNFPPGEKTDVIVADETDAEYSVLLRPKRYTVGIGMKRGKDEAGAEAFFLEVLKKNGIGPEDVYAICTIDIKEDEPAIKSLRDKYRIPVLSFDKEILSKVNGRFHGSDFVKSVTGVDNVCERAAVAGAGAGAEIVFGKHAKDGMTIAIACNPGRSVGLM
ncbi:MAG: cobalamin biosynthesis protein [Butyrivibrio sp.]|nr:cobalamin biosynthesis protein [Butyrivibrio sp.]